MKQNPYNGYATEIGASIGNLMKGLLAPQGNRYQNELYQARTAQAQAAADETRAKIASDAAEAQGIRDGRAIMDEAFNRGYGQLEERTRPGEGFVGPMPANTRGQQVQKYLPQFQRGALASGVKPEHLDELVRSYVMNSGMYADPREGAFVGAGGEFKTSGGANAITTERQDSLQQGEFGQETSINNADNTSLERRNAADNIARGERNDATIAGEMARKVKELEFGRDNPKDFTLSDGAIRYAPDGTVIASNNKDFASTATGKLTKLKPGEIAIDQDGNVVGKGGEALGKPIKLKPGEVALMPDGTQIGEGKAADPLVLKPGEIAYDGDGKVIAKGAEVPGKKPTTRVVSPGQSVVDETGKVIFKADPKAAKAAKPIKVNPGQAVVHPNTGELIYQADPKPAKPETVLDQTRRLEAIQNGLLNSGMMSGVPEGQLPPNWNQMIANADAAVQGGKSIPQAIAEAIADSGYEWSEDRPGTSISNLFSSDAGWIKRTTEPNPGATGGGTGEQNGGPAVGTIEDGMKFLGGNPADPKSWEPI